jgi:hypothetical protein
VTIGTDAFDELLQLEAEQRGLPDLKRVIVPHPLGGLKDAAVQEKVPPIVEALMASLVSAP